MIYEDVAVAVVVVLFLWLIPRSGIRWFRRREKLPLGSPGLAGSPGLPPARPGQVAPRPVPPDEMIGRPRGNRRDRRDERILAELDATWDPGYADREAARQQSRNKPA